MAGSGICVICGGVLEYMVAWSSIELRVGSEGLTLFSPI
jgi:hypothetical protein